jgi:hypothetical protein
MKQSGILDFLQAMSNSAASAVSGPVDLSAAALRAAGVPVPENALLSSAWMAERGLTRKPRSALMEVLGESAGAVLPVAAAAKAPQIARGVLKAAENAAAPKAAGQAAAQRGAIVWHGSPHKFDRFDSSKIGTGEGAQAYGHGLYLAERKAVADEYAGKLSQKVVDFANKAPTTAAEKRLAKRLETVANTTQYDAAGEMVGKSYERALNPSRDVMYGNSYVGIKPMPPRMLGETLASKRAAERLGAPSVRDAGNLYKVDLPDEKIARMLDWDKPLSQQAPAARAAIEKIAPKNRSGQPMLDLDANGGELLRALGLGDGSSSLLRQQGIPGIRYLDGSSRGAGAGTSNFVVFPGEEEALRILERNGQPLGILDVLR